jgi:hypothetical protein
MNANFQALNFSAIGIKYINVFKKSKIIVIEAAEIMEPETGHLKIGDLSGIREYKFQSLQEQVLLAYEVVGNHLYLYACGTHENFYRRLRKYLDR